jgi:hypothetical protein
MSFRDFDLPRVEHDFGVRTTTNRALFRGVAPVTPHPVLLQCLERYGPVGMANASEKARSEWLVAPLLAEVWERSGRELSLLSGALLEVDAAAGLTGVCDFAFSRSPQMLYLVAPVMLIVEAKRDNLIDGLGQCAAEMVAAQRWNQQHQQHFEFMHGCVTTGSIWKFLRLKEQALAIDLDEYSIQQPERILGVLLHSCGVPV